MHLYLLLTGVVVIVGYFGFLFLRNLVSRPILKINLSPVDNPKWKDTKTITDLIYSFQQKGFESAGNFICLEIPSLIISGFVHPAEQMSGVIYDHPVHGIWVDIIVHYIDGESLTVSSAPAGQELDHMPHQEKFYYKGNSFNELFAKVLTERKGAGRITITKETFVSHFESQYQKEMNWRIDRGGPTYLEVRRVADAMGGSADRERLEKVTHQMQSTWALEKNKPRKIRKEADTIGLPGEFQRREEFRRKMEQKSGPAPRLIVPAMPVYLILISAMAYWCYYGWQYSKTHFPISWIAVIVFLGVFLVPFLITLVFRDFNRRVKMYPVLKRMAGLRPGAFLVVEGTSPALFYARDTWIGKVLFEEGGETQDAFTRLDARIRQPAGQLEIYKKSILDKLSGRPEKDVIQLPESEFSRKFMVSGADAEFTKKFLNPAVSAAIMRLAEFGDPVVDIDSNAVRVEIGKDLSSPRKEAALRQFLDDAETIIEQAARENLFDPFGKV